MKTIGLFCGGYSSEFEISLKSAQTIQDHFPAHFNMVKIIVKNENEWFAEYNETLIPFSIDTLSFFADGKEQKMDLGLVYIHGTPGEDGKIQALLDLKKVPYLNSNVLASSLSFDKWYCNQFLSNFQIPVAKSLFLSEVNDFTNEYIVDFLGLPVFVKPSDSGSSFGISKVKSESDLDAALKKAFKEGNTVVIESFLKGTEVTCGVYKNKQGIQALPLTEIATENEFFDYDAKYNGKSQEITPARIDEEMTQKVQERAKFIYSLLGLKSIARIDFMVVNNEPFVIEVNTTPGFSPASIVPQMLACAGISITNFWAEILEEAGY